MSQEFVIDVEVRQDKGKGASRRLRREQNTVPAVLYGGKEQPQNLSVNYFTIKKALEHEAFYTSLIKLKVNGKEETVILRDIQRHPYKTMIQHMDFQRVNLDQELVMHVPLHFVNEDSAPGVRAGGNVFHTISGVDVRCKARNIPEFIEVDLSQLELDGVIHLSDLKLPKDVELNVDLSDSHHNQSVVTIHLPRVEAEPEEGVAAEGEAQEGEAEKAAGEEKSEGESKEE